MKDAEVYSLLDDVRRADRRFRTSAGIFMAIVGLALIGMIAVQYWQLREFRDQSAERAAAIKQLSESAANNSAQTNHYLQCIARFFATTDRQNRVLKDLDTCAYENNGRPVPGVDTDPTRQRTGQEQSPAPSNQNSQTENINPNSPGLVPGTPDLEEPEPETPPAEPRPPVEVLGIPVCVPFTDVCLRQ